MTARAGKMGKSKKNAISPDDVYAAYGADTLRLYEMAMGPLDTDRPWRTDDIVGSHRFLQRQIGQEQVDVLERRHLVRHLMRVEAAPNGHDVLHRIVVEPRYLVAGLPLLARGTAPIGVTLMNIARNSALLRDRLRGRERRRARYAVAALHPVSSGP